MLSQQFSALDELRGLFSLARMKKQLLLTLLSENIGLNTARRGATDLPRQALLVPVRRHEVHVGDRLIESV